MGCDVHMFCEVRKNNKWELVGNVFKNAYYSEEKPESEWNTPFTSSPYEGRNYDLFAILADVRNGRGFAGVETGEGFNPISDPKGLPEDVSPEIKADSDEWDCDGHSHSWFTVKELEEYNWDQTTEKCGIISIQEFKDLMNKGGGWPDSWCGYISGPGITIIEEEEAKRLISESTRTEVDSRTHVKYHWKAKYSDSASSFLENTLPQLKALGDPEDVRIVFWFDN